LPIERSRRSFSASRIAKLFRELLDASTLCAISTVSPRGRAHVNNVYFAYTREFEIIWISEPRARHSLNLRLNGTAAVAAFDSGQVWGGEDRGIQLFGSAARAVGDAADDALVVYGERFPSYVPEEYPSYAPYRFRPGRVKLFDEPSLGPGVFVTAKVSPKGQLSWERTEIYRP
jgi:uncharacterized protein YhbP (UPF0306 family)